MLTTSAVYDNLAGNGEGTPDDYEGSFARIPRSICDVKVF